MSGLILQCFTLALVGQALAAAVENCHLENLSTCGDPLTAFRMEMGTSFPTNNDQVKNLCSKMDEAYKCAEKFQNKCMTPLQLQTMGYLTGGSWEVYTDFCSDGSELRTDYLKHAACIDESSKTDEAKAYYTYIEAALENLSEKPPHERLPTACCGYSMLEKKLKEVGEAKCGKEAIEAFQNVVEMAVSTLPSVFCSGFEPEGKTCKAVLPPLGTKPKGTLKNSHVAQLFSSMYFQDLKDQ